MKFKDYKRLSKISIKSRKKSTRTTTRGIAFGLTMIIPVLFLGLALKLDIGSTMNETHNISTTVLTTNASDKTLIKKETEFTSVLPSISAANEIVEKNSEYVDSVIKANYLKLNWQYETKVNIAINDSTKDITNDVFNEAQQNNYFNSIKIIEDTETLIHPLYKEDLAADGKELFAAGQGFSKNPKGEILISESFARFMGESNESLIGKKFDLKVTSSSFGGINLDNDNDPTNEYENIGRTPLDAQIFDDFIIKGIISDDYYKLNSITLKDGLFWISNKSFDNVKYGPVITTKTIKDKDYERTETVATYVEDSMALANKAKDNKCMFFGAPLVYFNSPFKFMNEELSNNLTTVTFVQCKDYNSCYMFNNSAMAHLKSNYNVVSDFDGEYYETTNTFSSFQMLNKVSQYLILGLSIFGGIIFFATLLNLYNSVNYSVDARHNYLAMMRAIGAKNKVIPRLYLMEILLIFFKAIPWALVFSFGFSYGIKYMVDSIFQNGSMLLNATISLNLTYYFIALGVVLVSIFVIGLLFSFIACLPITRKKILDIFDDDK